MSLALRGDGLGASASLAASPAPAWPALAACAATARCASPARRPLGGRFPFPPTKSSSKTSGSAVPARASPPTTGRPAPKVERILAHLMLRRQGGRRARVSEGASSVPTSTSFAASRNLARFAVLGLRSTRRLGGSGRLKMQKGPRHTKAGRQTTPQLPPTPRPGGVWYRKRKNPGAAEQRASRTAVLLTYKGAISRRPPSTAFLQT